MTHRFLQLLVLTTVLSLIAVACGSDDEKDTTPPTISSAGITANPVDCQVYHRGDTIPFCYVFQDDTELGNYNIEIHTNADHHSHSTSATECEDDDHDHVAVNPWVYNKDFTIPAGQLTYTSRLDIVIPDGVDTGDYHFMIRLTDRAGWQQFKAVAIKIE